VRTEAGADSTYLLECEHGQDLRETVFRAAVERGWILLGLAEEQASLEDIFVRLTTQESGTGAAPPLAAAPPAAEEVQP
jgi:hypothetical protein